MRSFLSLTFLLLLISLSDLDARVQQESGVGHRTGVSVAAGETNLLTMENLALLQDAGISVIEIEGMVSSPLPELLTEAGMFLFVRQERQFSIPQQLQNSESYLSEDRQLISYYESQLPGQVVAYGLFRYPAENSPDMRGQMSLHAAQLNVERENPVTLYYESAFTSVSEIPEGFAFRSERLNETPPVLTSAVSHFYPGKDDRTTVENLRDILTLSLDQSESVVLIELRPLLNLMERYDPITTALREYASNGEILFALPAPAAGTSAPNFTVIILIAILTGYFFHYKYNLFYRESLGRYFKTHHFFIEDVMEYRLRTPLAGLIQLLQFILVGGLFTWIFVEAQFSQLGLEALVGHFPIIDRLGTGMAGFFVLGMVITTVLQVLSLAVIHIPAFKTRSVGQTVNVYGWLLHLNLPVLILMIYLYETDSPAGWFELPAFLFLVIWLLNAVIACVDVARYLARYRILYLVFTIGTHLVIIALGVYTVMGNPEILQPLRLALNLP